MTRRKAVAAEFARKFDEVDELHTLIAGRTWDRGSATGIFIREPIDHAFAEAAFVIEDVVGDAQPVRDSLGIVDILTRATGAGTPHSLAVIVELQRDANHFRAGARGKSGHDGRIHAAGHGDDDPSAGGASPKFEIDGHDERLFTRSSLLTARRSCRQTSEFEVLARYESEFKAEREVTGGLAELLGSEGAQMSDRERQEAIVCYLTRSEGWQDAFKLLGGAFAPDASTR